MKRTYIFFLCLFLMALTEISAQTIPVNKRFGKVSREELELSSYDLDTAATALILYENKWTAIHLNAAGAFTQTTRTHMRIKILKEEGVSWGDFEMICHHSTKNQESVAGIDVVTYNLVDGKIVETKMPKKYIFTEDFTENYKKVTFSAQDVRVGSVIEVKFDRIDTRYWNLPDIYFQKNIPVNLVECEVRLPEFFTFNKKMTGYHRVDYAYDEDSGSLQTSDGQYGYNISIDKYSASDVPAFKKEPLVYNSRQYYSGVRYNISSLQIPGALYEDYSVSWNDVDNIYLESDLYRRFKAACQFKDETAVIAAEDTDVKKIEAVVRLVQDKVTWNEDYAVLPEPLAQTVKARSGSNVDMNCLAAGCLRELGFTVEPVMIKFRSSGMLLDYQPELNTFDTFILRVVTSSGNVYYLDCGASEGYLNVLDPLMLMPNARVLRPDGRSEWVDLTGLCESITAVYVVAELDPQNEINGKITIRYKGEDAYMAKMDYDSYADEDEYLEELEDDFDVEVVEYSSTGLKDFSEGASEQISFSDEPDAVGDLVYVNLFIDPFHSKDTFQSINRSYPIDFPYPYSISYRYTLKIPEGYTVEQLPENISIKLDEINASARVISRNDAQTIQIVFTYKQGSILGLPADYQSIRSFWQHLADIYGSVAVLKKI